MITEEEYEAYRQRLMAIHESANARERKVLSKQEANALWRLARELLKLAKPSREDVGNAP